MSSTIEDPTITSLATYNTTVAEAFIGLIVLAFTLALEVVNNFVHSDSRSSKYPHPSYDVIRTPEESFDGVREPYQHNYFQMNYHGQNFRIHYLDEGDPSSREVILCLHGEPLWSLSYHKLIPYLVKKGYRVIAPDFVGFGRSDKLVDWKAYTLGLQEDSIVQLLQHLNLPHQKVIVLFF
jgi:hypothetical protein